VAATSSLERKQQTIDRVSAQLADTQALILAEYRGLTVGAMTGLRAKARNSGVDLQVLKNTLARRAVKGTQFEKLSEEMSGPLVYGFAKDPIAGAKILADFAREHEHFVIRAGAMPNAVMSAAEVKVLATMPGRQELLAKLVGTMQAPMAKLVRTLNEVPGKFVRTLAALREAREKNAG
jgi:large subunit ribosomal protein L10